MTSYILHICDRADWERAIAAGEYRLASLETEGFIHASRPEQVIGVANRFYAGVTGLLLLWLDPERLTAPVRDDTVGAERFPHIYGPINLEAVIQVTSFAPDSDGIFRQLQSK